MAPEMMRTTNKSGLKKLFIYIFIILFCKPVFSAENVNWILAAENFSYAKGYVQNAVSEGSAEMFPISILEKLNKTLERNILPDEKYQRQCYKLRNERQSLFLQLSGEYKKRDTLVLNPYTDKELALKIKEQNKEIKKVQDKIAENIKKQKEAEVEASKRMELIYSGKLDTQEPDQSEIEIIKTFIKNIFTKDENIVTQENIYLYQNDFTRLYKPSESAKEAGYTSQNFIKEMMSSNINTLITGVISGYGDYISVAVELYLYPAGEKIASVMEIGTIQEADLITTSIANQIVPAITNAMPVLLDINIFPDELVHESMIYIDEILQTSNTDSILVESGVHDIQIVCEGFKTVETSYYFEGNKNYNIDVTLEKEVNGYLQINLVKPLLGDLLVNGEYADKIDEKKSQMKINGKVILGEFLSENGETAFFYIPQNLVLDSNMINIKPKPYDREKNIDKRRKWMYASYTLLMVSLIPTFYTYGNLVNEAKLYNDGLVNYSDAIELQKRSNIFQGISIGCGVFFAFELVRYIIAANAVLPQKAWQGNKDDFEFYDFSVVEETEESDKIEETNNAEVTDAE